MKKAVIVVLILLLCHVAFAHSGGTDSKGGHTDRSTGEYHYHHGYSAHQHENGVCPYDNDDKTTSSGSSTRSSSGSTATTSFMHSDLKRGDRGEYVKNLQNRLNMNGYSCGTADGVFGSKTENALKAYQKDHGLQALGVANYVTLARLFPENIPATPTPVPTATPRPTPTPPSRLEVLMDSASVAFGSYAAGFIAVNIGFVLCILVLWWLLKNIWLLLISRFMD